MEKIRILFLIHDLGQGGAEKVLVNLINNLDFNKFEVHLLSLFGGGVNEQFLLSKVNYKYIFSKSFPGNSHILKLLSPKLLHRLFIKENYDIEISYLEGPSARIVSGCNNNTKLVSWIHVEQHSLKVLSKSFRNSKEAIACYNAFDQTICVSEYVKNDFCDILKFSKPCKVLYNTVESERIISDSKEDISHVFEEDMINLVAVGTLKESKGYGRMLNIINRLKKDGYSICLNILGIGPMQKGIEDYIERYSLEKNVILLGYKTNPYKYISKCDLFICASYAEGFSTAATEALILGVPVCTVEVSGMKEMLGNNNEYGLVVDNSEEALYQGIKKLLDDKVLLNHYKSMAKERGKMFSTDKTVMAVEEMLLDLYK